MNAFKAKSINQKQSLGQKLQEARLKMGASLKHASLVCKIPEKYLDALEKENWGALPGEVYVKNFLKTYCGFLKIHFGISFEQYKKKAFHESLKKKGNIRKNLPKRLYKYFTDLTTQQIRKVLLLIVLIFLIGYIYYETSSYLRPPQLDILFPTKNYTTTDNTMIIKGKTSPESVVYINSEMLAIEESGDFSVGVKLRGGINKFEIISQRKHGRQHVENVVVFKRDN